jgi:molecular chaperone GrpE (heat shock protein)
MRKDHIREQLEPLRNEARSLAERSSLSREDVDNWRRRTERAIKALCGGDSQPAQDFSRIRFDFNSAIDSFQRTIQERAEEEGVDISGLKIPLPSEQESLRRGLYEAVEILTTLMI